MVRALRMNRRMRRLSAGLALAAAGVAAVAAYWGHQWMSIGNSYEAKILCSGVFVSHRTPESLLQSDLSIDAFPVFRLANTQVDRVSRAVSADLFGLARRTAVFRDGLGCTVAQAGAVVAGLSSAIASVTPAVGTRRTADVWPIATEPAPDADRVRLQSALDGAFSEPDAAAPQRTRAVVIVHRGRLVGERYAQGFTQETPLLGWSMTKSVVNALVGILVKDAKMSLDTPVAVSEWQESGDPRGQITLNHLLHMSSGLQFNEGYSSAFVDVAHMLFGAPNMAGFAAAKPLQAEPGTRWSYSSGDTNIITGAMAQAVGAAAYHDFPRQALFDRLGMHSAVMETDAAGTFVGSSFMYATARDWARFGLLYLNDGVAGGQRILPRGWVAYSRTPTAAAPEQQYAAHFWLKIPVEYRRDLSLRPLPSDAYHAIGHEGQFLTIVPSRQLVVVRLGQTRSPAVWDHHAFLNGVLDATADFDWHETIRTTSSTPSAVADQRAPVR